MTPFYGGLIIDRTIQNFYRGGNIEGLEEAIRHDEAGSVLELE